MEDAARHWEKAVALSETDLSAPFMLISCYTALGDGEKTPRSARISLSRAENAVAQHRINGSAMDTGVGALAALGETDKAKEWMNRGLLIDPDNLTMRYNFACALASLLGDPDAALDMLGPVLERNPGTFVSALANDPDFAGLRDDPRFQAMVAAANARLAAAKPADAAAAQESGQRYSCADDRGLNRWVTMIWRSWDVERIDRDDA